MAAENQSGTRALRSRLIGVSLGFPRCTVVVHARATRRSRDAILRAAIADAMRACHGNVTEAARRLGVARTTVYRALRDVRGTTSR